MPTPHPTPLTLAVIVASTRAGRFGPTVADWFLDHVRTRPELAPVVVDVAAADLPHTFGAPAPALADIGATLAAADAFVVVTPEYNHSYPGGLKNLIDLHSAQWRAKPVAFVSYGGRSGGLRAVEHLRAVFAELHTVTVRDTVSFHDPWTARDDTGALQAGEGADLAAKTLLDQLVWWAEALRAARATRPYVA
ncbi:NAD(P)H-dependent oxidoreductase [Nocardia farcinica]|uniref:NADPH-dependent FMN reductase n=1 Tax=Nocardia farcinica TaxID=37329 RepID=UPI00189356EE|nr:NAD(P)H-dependent oxidoreductase [Nocardia farcinica]MBF6249283.1 NAD(P)H-dependent oxidoreductase [Nocardia farcinica]MBF6259624.1 NAD(P)H-dependent oxidoreductase [Nocardia farcinica]MBF6260603.1 NAD(P)H-dependent oxidoreductase [Nocardia farcinica]MBF6279727.1 NAD(P)H-dependent oxidoreductase [Nocardia farcinica]MBF6303613.1 NAD(P)H-dependent oxidoreductase [Nocardia farcinica]